MKDLLAPTRICSISGPLVRQRRPCVRRTFRRQNSQKRINHYRCDPSKMGSGQDSREESVQQISKLFLFPLPPAQTVMTVRIE